MIIHKSHPKSYLKFYTNKILIIHNFVQQYIFHQDVHPYVSLFRTRVLCDKVDCNIGATAFIDLQDTNCKEITLLSKAIKKTDRKLWNDCNF